MNQKKYPTIAKRHFLPLKTCQQHPETTTLQNFNTLNKKKRAKNFAKNLLRRWFRLLRYWFESSSVILRMAFGNPLAL